MREANFVFTTRRIRGAAAALQRGWRGSVKTVLSGPVVAAACAPRTVDDYLALFDPTWSLSEVRARIVAVRHETGRAVSLRLAPNANWQGYVAGQYVRLTARVDGVRQPRCFSLSSAPHEPWLQLTLRRYGDGAVSEWAARHARPGQIVELSQALGHFVLPDPLPPRLLFISGGAGITPMRSFLHHLRHRGHRGHVVLLHFARDEVLFEAELCELARYSANVHFVSVTTRDVKQQPLGDRLSRALLDRVAPAWMESDVFVCGPRGLEQAVTELMIAHGRRRHVHVERFVAPLRNPSNVPGKGGRYELRFAHSGRTVRGGGDTVLLVQAERAGLRPAHGCRMGICRSCVCRKQSGVVRNITTGALSGPGEEDIQLCVSVPQTNVTIEL